MKNITTILILFAMLLGYGESVACTSAIVLSSRSSERVPMLWKHRDSPSWDCHVEYIEGGKYAYTALVSPDRKYTYCGINEKGFAVMNTVSENLTKSKIVSQSPGAISSMTMALRECATVDEFEAWLRSTNDTRSYVTNFAVGDAMGAVASAVMVCDGANPRMLAMVGHPVVGVPVPVYVKAKRAIPECVGGRSALELSEEFRAKAYKMLDELRYEVNEPLVKALLKLGAQYKMPRTMPRDIEKFNAKIDQFFANHAKRVRKVME